MQNMSTTNLSQKQLELKAAFNSTKYTEELLKTYEEMETCFDQKDLAIECATLAQTLSQQNRRQDVRIFMMKSNKILLGNDKCSSGNTCSLDDNYNFLYAKACNFMGSTCLDAKNYDGSLKNLNLANMILTTKFEIDEASRCAGNCVLRAIDMNQYLLHRVKMFTNNTKESALHAKNSLEVKEKLLEEGCHELALANMDVFFAYGMAMSFKEALPYGWKALEIHEKNLGSESLEVAKMRSNLAFMYHELGEHEKAFELEELAENVHKEECDSPEELIKAGRYEEAIAVLKGNVTRDDIKVDIRALDFFSMANAFYKLGKFPDAKKHLRTAEEILENCPGFLNQKYVAAFFMDMSELYEKMNDNEAALSLVKKVLAIPDLPHNLLSRSLSSLLSLIPESSNAREEIPDILAVVEKLNVSFGPESREVGYVYAHLGVAYWNLGHQESAVKFLEDAKGILDATIGPNHINSLKTSHTLSESYAKMHRYAQALEIEEKVVKGLKGLAPSELGFMHEVFKLLSKMKERVAESPTTASSQSNDGGLSAMISKCDISDDGKGI